MGPLLQGFAPMVGDSPRVLVLGNMPSAMSLEVQQYYGNPRNAFWRIMAELYGCPTDAPYDDRCARLFANGIAVWDVLRSCRRVGSLDSAVERDSMVANDFASFFAMRPGIDRVLFNGGAAEANFRRLVKVDGEYGYARLPSTSPAHTMRYADKLAAWRAAML